MTNLEAIHRIEELWTEAGEDRGWFKYSKMREIAVNFAMKLDEAERTAVPEEHAGWNAAVRAAVKILRSNADGCSPGSTAEQQNWPFVLECMAREVEKLALPQRVQPQEEKP